MLDLSNEFELLMEEWKKTETKFIFATNLGIPPTPDEAGYDLETNRFHRSDTEWIWAFCLAGHVVPPKRKSWESSHEKSGSVFLSPEHHYRCQDLCSPCHPRRHMDEHFQGRQGRMVSEKNDWEDANRLASPECVVLIAWRWHDPWCYETRHHYLRWKPKHDPQCRDPTRRMSKECCVRKSKTL